MNRIFPIKTSGPVAASDDHRAASDSMGSLEASVPGLDIVANLRGVLESVPTDDADDPNRVVARWQLPEPFEPSYAYPVIVHVCSDAAEWATTETWIELLGRQNAAVLSVFVPPNQSVDSTTVDGARLQTYESLRTVMGAAWLGKPSQLVVREDRVYGLAHGATASWLVQDWLQQSPWFAGVAAIAPSDPPNLPAGLARLSGRLLVTGRSDWSRAAATLYAAGTDVELRPQAGDIVTVSNLVNAWMMRSIPTAIGV